MDKYDEGYQDAKDLYIDKVRSLEQEVERLKAFILNGTCPSAAGFEGPETYPDCGNCVYCELKYPNED